MPLRMILDAGAVDPAQVALLGVRDLDPPEREFIRGAGIHTGRDAVDHALHEVDCVYVALDFDGLDEADVASFMPVAGGIRLDEAVETFRRIAATKTVLGAGFTGLVPAERNLEPAAQLASALGL
jgi:arginase